MLVIRYFRIGKTNQPYFKVVVTDKRRPTKGGRFVEEVGFIDPVKKVKKLNAERIKYWLSVGAQPSDTVHNLLIAEKITEGKKIPVHHKKKVEKAAAAPVAAQVVKGTEAAKPKETEKAEAGKEEVKKSASVDVAVEAKVEEAATVGKEEPKIEAKKEDVKPVA
jgi:small subunit ribosomal protein S16